MFHIRKAYSFNYENSHYHNIPNTINLRNKKTNENFTKIPKYHTQKCWLIDITNTKSGNN